jgi:hypothetical protein
VKTLKDIQDLITANLASSDERLSNHAFTLIAPRTHGSTTEKSIMDAPGDIPVYLLDDQSNVMDGAVAFGFNDSSIGGVEAAMPLSFVLENWPWAIIEERDGVHGRELFGKLPSHKSPICPRATSQFTVIIGEHEGEQAVFTWHPGLPLAPGTNRDNPNTAVKLL